MTIALTFMYADLSFFTNWFTFIVKLYLQSEIVYWKLYSDALKSMTALKTRLRGLQDISIIDTKLYIFFIKIKQSRCITWSRDQIYEPLPTMVWLTKMQKDSNDCVHFHRIMEFLHQRRIWKTFLKRKFEFIFHLMNYVLKFEFYLFRWSTLIWSKSLTNGIWFFWILRRRPLIVTANIQR